MNRTIATSLFACVILFCTSCATSRSVELPFREEKTKSLGLDMVPSVHFDIESDRVGNGSRWVLNNNALWMKENPNAFIILEGHCDGRGSDEFNLELGDRRARNVREELIRLGASPSSFAIVSYGESRPIDTGNSGTSMYNNRRVAFVVR